MSCSCQTIHSYANSLLKYREGFTLEELPKNGVYLLFEENEFSHGSNRIVRVGTHKSEGGLGKRLYEHIYKPNKDRSIFRKHIGRCLLDGDPFLEHWNICLTSRAAKLKYGDSIDFKKQQSVEEAVTNYITVKFSFAVIQVETKQKRLKVESSLLATISNCEECLPSMGWLGLKHQNPTIRKGLWNIQGLGGPKLTVDEVDNIFKG